jgi:hypothetical protein
MHEQARNRGPEFSCRVLETKEPGAVAEEGAMIPLVRRPRIPFSPPGISQIVFRTSAKCTIVERVVKPFNVPA